MHDRTYRFHSLSWHDHMNAKEMYEYCGEFYIELNSFVVTPLRRTKQLTFKIKSQSFFPTKAVERNPTVQVLVCHWTTENVAAEWAKTNVFQAENKHCFLFDRTRINLLLFGGVSIAYCSIIKQNLLMIKFFSSLKCTDGSVNWFEHASTMLVHANRH